jgi:hypothetical protein
MSTELKELTSAQREVRRCRLANLKGNLRKVKKRLSLLSKLAKPTGLIWVWRVNAISEEVNKLLANLEAEEKKMR